MFLYIMGSDKFRLMIPLKVPFKVLLYKDIQTFLLKLLSNIPNYVEIFLLKMYNKPFSSNYFL